MRKEVFEMKIRKLVLVIAAAFLLLTWFAPSIAQAAVKEKETVKIGEDFTVEKNETIEGGVVVIDGDATVAGEIEKDLVVIGGNVDLESTAVVKGDLMSIGGEVTRAEGAEIGGDEITGIPRLEKLIVGGVPLVGLPLLDWMGWVSRFLSFLGYLALVLIVVALLPKHTEVAANAIEANPWGTLGIGFLVFLAFIPGLLFLIITLIGIFLIPFWVLLYAVSWLFASVIAGLFVGQKVAGATNSDMSPILAALVGALIIGALRFVPFFGSLVGFVAAAFGLGSIIKTKYGTGRPWFKKKNATAQPA
jgi:hypothetical protein